MHKIHKLVMVPFIPYEVVQNVIFYCSVNGTYGYNYDKRYSPDFLKEKHGIPNHMHLVSNEPFTNGDIIINRVTKQTYLFGEVLPDENFKGEYRKVIASTKKFHIKLPIIDPGFIKGILDDLSPDVLEMDVKVGYKPLSDSEIVKLINWDNWRGENGVELQKQEVKRSEILKQNGIIWVSEENYVTLAPVKQTFTREETLQVALLASKDNYISLYDWFNNKF